MLGQNTSAHFLQKVGQITWVGRLPSWWGRIPGHRQKWGAEYLGAAKSGAEYLGAAKSEAEYLGAVITTSNHTLLLHDSLTPHTGISNVQRAQAALRHWHYSYTLERNRKG